MSDQRQYNEKEIAQIFEEAAKELEESRNQRLTGEGLSLAELQAIGADSGIPPEFIARAASRLYQASPTALSSTASPFEKSWGAPIGVSHTVALPRMVTEAEWNALVVDLRTTFDARGTIEQDGSFRQWTNGNLQILLEPIGKGSRLRMETTNASAKSGLAVGPFYTAMALILPLIMLFTGFMPALLAISAFIFLVGWAVWGYYKLTTPKWAEARKSQMEAVAARLMAQVASLADPAEATDNSPAISLDSEPEPGEALQTRSPTRLRS